MSRKGSYLGGHSVMRGDPRGALVIADSRPKKVKAADARERSNLEYEKWIAAQNEREALRRFVVTKADEAQLGYDTSKWPDYQVKLREKLLVLRKSNIHRADHISGAFNRIGFKTATGQIWTPRLIKIARMKLANES